MDGRCVCAWEQSIEVDGTFGPVWFTVDGDFVLNILFFSSSSTSFVTWALSFTISTRFVPFVVLFFCLAMKIFSLLHQPARIHTHSPQLRRKKKWMNKSNREKKKGYKLSAPVCCLFQWQFFFKDARTQLSAIWCKKNFFRFINSWRNIRNCFPSKKSIGYRVAPG